jgi:hypothetical protein
MQCAKIPRLGDSSTITDLHHAFGCLKIKYTGKIRYRCIIVLKSVVDSEAFRSILKEHLICIFQWLRSLKTLQI